MLTNTMHATKILVRFYSLVLVVSTVNISCWQNQESLLCPLRSILRHDTPVCIHSYQVCAKSPLALNALVKPYEFRGTGTHAREQFICNDNREYRNQISIDYSYSCMQRVRTFNLFMHVHSVVRNVFDPAKRHRINSISISYALWSMQLRLVINSRINI